MKALELGTDAEEIAEAIEMGKRVKLISKREKSASCYQPTKAASYGCCS